MQETKESLKCTKCKRTGHVAKICRSKTDNSSTPKRNDKARAATTTTKAEEDEDDTAIHEARTLCSD